MIQLTVGTDPVDGYKRFCRCSCLRISFYMLVFRQPFGGNDMIKGPGGGHKVVLFRNI